MIKKTANKQVGSAKYYIFLKVPNLKYTLMLTT